MATLTIRRVGGPLAPLNPANIQWHGDGCFVTRPTVGGRIVAVNLPAEHVAHLVGQAFAEEGLPLPPHVGGPIIGGLFSRIKKAAHRAVRKVADPVERAARSVAPKSVQREAARVNRAAHKAAKKLNKAADQAAAIYANPATTAALLAVSAAVPVVAPVTGPLATGSMYAASVQSGRRAVRALSHGDWQGAAMGAAGAIPGAGGYVQQAQQGLSAFRNVQRGNWGGLALQGLQQLPGVQQAQALQALGVSPEALAQLNRYASAAHPYAGLARPLYRRQLGI